MSSVPSEKLACNIYFFPAGEGDCILIQYQSSKSDYHNILIDGGNRNRLEFKKQKSQILKVIDNGNKGQLDLVIVTHSDDDHIKGILKLVADSELEPYVKKYWFNSEKTVCEHLNSEYLKTQDYTLDKKSDGISRSSRNQDHDLYHYLKNSCKWDKEVIHSGLTSMIGNLKITVISPTKDKLLSLNKHWPKLPLNAKNAALSSNCVSDHTKALDELYTELNKFEEDESPINGASIALIVEWCSFRWLFLSDSHPTTIVEYLKQDGYTSINKSNFDFVKVSHHGSRKNTNDELLSLINSLDYVITTNGKKHCHPHKICLARIIHNNSEDINFHFNYKNAITEGIFSSKEFNNTFFPKNSEDGINFYYES